jgi:crossover junction endodeoxyribonuclease RuvC
VFDPDASAGAAKVVLGIDPGLSRCGYGAVDSGGRSPVPVAYGVIRTPAGEELAARLAMLEAELERLVDELRPGAVAVERVLFQANVRTAMSVGQASGLALAVAARAGIPVVHYSPNEVKLAVTGYGGADKAQVQQMVTRLLGLSEPPRPPDAADALALALCYSWGRPVRAAAAAHAPAADGLSRAVAAALAKEECR